jgi:hypothetical protein
MCNRFTSETAAVRNGGRFASETATWIQNQNVNTDTGAAGIVSSELIKVMVMVMVGKGKGGGRAVSVLYSHVITSNIGPRKPRLYSSVLAKHVKCKILAG